MRSSGRHGAARHHAGFTLLELLVVLALIALLSGLALPAVSGWLASVQARAVQRDLRALVESLPIKAFRQGQAMAVDADGVAAMLPGFDTRAMRIELARPLQYGADGVAGGGVLRLLRSGQPPVAWQVEPVTGRVLESGAAQRPATR